jgi:hypothetical protein
MSAVVSWFDEFTKAGLPLALCRTSTYVTVSNATPQPRNSTP